MEHLFFRWKHFLVGVLQTLFDSKNINIHVYFSKRIKFVSQVQKHQRNKRKYAKNGRSCCSMEKICNVLQNYDMYSVRKKNPNRNACRLFSVASIGNLSVFATGLVVEFL